jgi:hypothetical protein
MQTAQVSMQFAQAHNALVVTLQHKAHTLQVHVRDNARTREECEAVGAAEMYKSWLWEFYNGEGSADEDIVYDGKEQCYC